MTSSTVPQPRVEPGSRTYVAATWLSHMLNPTYSLLPILLLVTYSGTSSWLEAFKWVGLAGLMVLLPVMAFIHRRVRAGVYADSQVSVREQRHIVYALGAICTTFYSLTLVLLGGPIHLQAALMALFAAGLTAMAINFLSKVSIHVGGMTGLVMVLIIVFGRGAWPALVLVPLVGWSRVVLGRHTVPQVITGGITAAAVTTAVLRAYGL